MNLKEYNILQGRFYQKILNGRQDQFVVDHLDVFCKIAAMYRLHTNRIAFHGNAIKKIVDNIDKK